MKSNRLLVVGLLVLFMVGCAVAPQKPKSYSVTISPKVTASASRQVINSDLSVVMSAGISEKFNIERGNKMVLIEVGNFREAIAATLKTTFAPQFKSVSSSNKETGKGLELVILGANYPDINDSLAYHFALMSNGKLVYEYKNQTVPVSKMMGVTVDTWQDETSKVTVEMLESNVSHMSEQIRDKLLINEALTGFWEKQRK